jgi:hypothetical protein
MNPKIQNLEEHFSNGLVLEDSLPIKQRIALLEDENPGAIEKITWAVDGKIYSARAASWPGRYELPNNDTTMA